MGVWDRNKDAIRITDVEPSTMGSLGVDSSDAKYYGFPNVEEVQAVEAGKKTEGSFDVVGKMHVLNLSLPYGVTCKIYNNGTLFFRSDGNEVGALHFGNFKHGGIVLDKVKVEIENFTETSQSVRVGLVVI